MPGRPGYDAPSGADGQRSWDSDFDIEALAPGDWLGRTVYTPDGEALGVVTAVRPDDRSPRTIVVRTLPAYFDLGLSLGFDVESEITALGENAYSAQISGAAMEEKTAQER